MSSLASTVHVSDADGVAHVFGPESQVPAWAVPLIVNPKAWASPPAADEPSAVTPKEKAFSQLNREELEALAAVEGANIADLGTNKEIREAIISHRETK